MLVTNKVILVLSIFKVLRDRRPRNQRCRLCVCEIERHRERERCLFFKQQWTLDLIPLSALRLLITLNNKLYLILKVDRFALREQLLRIINMVTETKIRRRNAGAKVREGKQSI